MSDARSNRPPAPKKAASGPSDRKAPKGRKAGKFGKDGKARKKPRTRKQRILGVVKWLLIVGLVGALGLMGLFVIAYKSISIPDPNKDFQTQTSFVYYADGKTELGKFATQNRTVLAFKDMPQNVKDAVVAAEDRTFYTNSGIDPKGIIRAAFNDARGGATQGASTITQQYVKILYLTQERSIKRKIKEAILSLKIQKSQSKQEILQGYLNTIYFGRGAYGVQAAAQAYFNVDAKDLTLQQSAVLASVLNNPTTFDPANGKANKRALLQRYRYVLTGMAQMGNITAQKATTAGKHLPRFPTIQAQSQYGGQRGHMLKLVRDELHALHISDDLIDGGGLRIKTTFTPKAMQAAKDGVLQVRPKGISDKELHVAVASVEPGTGALRGFYGGQDYLRSQINWSIAGGMVGSTFKPVSLAAAIQDGYSLKSTWQGNSPFTFPDGLTVQNEGSGTGTNYGASVNSIYALEQSINTAFVDMTNSMKNGPQKVLTMANKMGIPPKTPDKNYPGLPSSTRDLDPDALITLGKARISPINMANTYATLANGGQRADVHVIDSVTTSDGQQLYQYKQHTAKAVSTDIASDVTYAMQQVVLHGTGANAQALGRPVAGKTGTATAPSPQGPDHVSSSWFVGFTPQLSTAVMYVRGDGDNALDQNFLPPYNGASGYFGAGYPTATWAAVMKEDMAGLPIEQFPPPAYVTGNPPQPGHAATTPPPPPTSTHVTRPPSHSPSSSAPTTAPTTSAPPTSAPPTSAPPTSSSPTVIPSCVPSCPSSSSPPPPPPSSSAPPSSSPSASAGPSQSPPAGREPWWW